MLKNTKVVYWGLIPIVSLGLVGAGAVTYIDSAGSRFFANGKEIKEDIGGLAHALKAKDLSAAGTYYATQYSGSPLGLNALRQSELKDGIHRSLLTSDSSTAGKAAAVDEWRKYFESFDSIDEVSLYVDKLEEWGSTDNLKARIRFEVIAAPHGAPNAGIDRGYFQMSFKAGGPHGLEITSASLDEGDRYIGDKPHFTNVAHDAGVDFMNQYYPAFLNQKMAFGMIRYGPAGITVADVDNDGFYDIFIPDGVESKLFHNLGNGKFEDITAKSGLAGLDGVSVALFADYDNDGYKDLFVSRTFKPNQLFHNNHDGTFTDVTAKSGIGEDCCTTVASWADYDNDGYLDLYVGRYLDPRKEIPTTFYARNGLPNQLYHNNHDGTFTNVTEKAGVGEVGLCLGTVFGDYNDDGYPDIYVVNDFGRKTLYRNNKDGTFTDVTVAEAARLRTARA